MTGHTRIADPQGDATNPSAPFTLSAPARVNLLGEHTDYTGGYVLPMAIPFQTDATITPSAEYVFSSSNFTGERKLRVDETPQPLKDWSDYAVGVLVELRKLGIDPAPFHLQVSGNVPLGAGLSSSASIEVACCLAMLRWTGATLPVKEIALLCQRAENLFVGSPCGIMDQFVITAATRGHALLLNTGSLEFDLVPMDAGGFRDACIVVCNSAVKHSVATGQYGSIRLQMEAGQTVLRERFGVIDLGHATLDQLEWSRSDMSEHSYRRCLHVITENARVLRARTAMQDGDVEVMGRLMIEGHYSQRDDLQTSCAEIDFLVDTAVRLPGFLGARMTGGGFGGCTVNLVARDQADDFVKQLTAAYREEWHIDADAWVCTAVDGAVAASEEPQ